MDFFEIFPWDKNFETGIEVIDEQHKKLVDILNRLAAHLANRSDSMVLDRVFDELADYADYHFKTEEAIWQGRLAGDDWLIGHERSHETFIKQLIELKSDQSDKDYDDVIQEVVSFLVQWLAFHILDNDRRMALVLSALDAGDSVQQAKVYANEAMSGSMQVLIQTVLRMYDGLTVRTMDLMREKALRRQAEEALNASEERWKFVLEGSSENVWDWNIEQGVECHSDDDSTLFDLVGHEMLGDEAVSRIHPDDIEQLKSDLCAHLNGKTEFYSNKHRVMRPVGGWAWVLTRGKVVSRDENGRALRMVGTHSDITERELAALIYRHSSQAMVVCDLMNRIISTNPAFENVTGYSAQEAVGRNPSFMSAGLHDEAFYNGMWRTIESKGHWRGEVHNRRKNGELYYAALDINVVTDELGAVDHYIGLFSDITEQKQAEKLIQTQANYDSLTKLPNRHMCLDLLGREIKRSRRSGQPFALFYIDLDHFKEVNDTLTHEIGDQLLVEVAKRMLSCVRESDVVSRIGGDEFTVILADLLETGHVDRVAQKIIDVLSEPFDVEQNRLYISASIGITYYPNDAQDVAGLLQNADQTMYSAKWSGRGRYRYFTPSMHEAAQRRQRLLNDLRLALVEHQFELLFQPIVDLKSGKIRKAEALLRWRHPAFGLLLPEDFIPLAEESGLIVEIGQWVHDEACLQSKSWRDYFGKDFQISINKSPVEFRDQNSLNTMLNHLIEMDVPGDLCVVEITENLLMVSKDEILQQFVMLRDVNIEVALDDFGTGYSSLSYLKDFHIDYIKIDQSFISNLTIDSQELVLCEAMIVMAHKLGIKVVAEGVESELHQTLLTDIGCDFAQGYFYSMPLSAAEFAQKFTL